MTVTRFAVAAACATALGCSSPPEVKIPETVPTAGTVVNWSGKAVTGGTVEFIPKAFPALPAAADIQPDGSYSLTTNYEGQSLPGAVPGEYEVRIYPVVPAGGKDAPIRLRSVWVRAAGAGPLNLNPNQQ